MSGPQQQSAHPAVAINGGMLGAVLFGWGAWAIWPTSPEWWGLGVTSVLFAMAAFGCLANAFGAMIGRYVRERELHRYLSQGAGPKSATLASEDDLRRAEMIE